MSITFTASRVSTRIRRIHRIVPHVAIAVQAPRGGRVLDDRIRLHKARQARVVDPAVHMHHAHFVQMLVAGKAPQSYRGGQLEVRRIRDRGVFPLTIPLGFDGLAPGVAVQLMSDRAHMVRNQGQGTQMVLDQVVGFVLCQAATAVERLGENGYATGNGALPLDGVVRVVDFFHIAEVQGGGRTAAVAVGALVATAVRAVAELGGVVALGDGLYNRHRRSGRRRSVTGNRRSTDLS